jgi:hypothetical protein
MHLRKIIVALSACLFGHTIARPADPVPAPRAHHSSVYDEARHEMLIYGGFTFDGKVTRLGDLWAWPTPASRGSSR